MGGEVAFTDGLAPHDPIYVIATVGWGMKEERHSSIDEIFSFQLHFNEIMRSK